MKEGEVMRIDVQKEVEGFIEARQGNKRKILQEKQDSILRVADKILSSKIPRILSRNSIQIIALHLSLDKDDIKQECLMLLMASLESYDPKRNNKFISYYLFNVRRQILKLVYKVDTIVKRDKVQKISIYQPIVKDGEFLTVADLLVKSNDIRERIFYNEVFERILVKLNDRERKVLLDFLNNSPKNKPNFSYKDLSKRHKVSTATICKLFVRIVRKSKAVYAAEVSI